MTNSQNNKLKSFFRPIGISKIAIGVVLFVLIIVPIIRMMFYITPSALGSVFKSNSFYTALLNSLTSTITATVFSIILAYALAWAINRTSIKLKYLFTVLITLPMLIPSVSHGMGLIILFGNNGFITHLFGLQRSSLYGFWGVVLGSILYSFPVAFIMLSDILKYEDQSPYEAADVLGIPKHRQLVSITGPYLRKPLISVVFAVFTMIVTDYGVTLSIGGQFQTLPVLLFNDIVNIDYSTDSVIGAVLLVPALAAFLFDLFNKDKGNTSFVLKTYNDRSIAKDIAGYAITLLTSLVVILVIFSFCIQAFAKTYPSDLSFSLKHFQKAFSRHGMDYLFNSIIISLLTSVVGVVVASSTAYLTSRIKSKFSRFLHLMAIVSLAVPGLVLGLSYVILFNKTFFYGTIVIIVMVNTVHFFASPYLMIYNAFNKTNENLEEVGHILGVRRFRIIIDVIIPQSKYTLIEMFSYFFVNSMMTISAVSFLARPENKPLSLMINEFKEQNLIECAAVIALLILGVNVLMKGIVYVVKTIGTKYVDKKAI